MSAAAQLGVALNDEQGRRLAGFAHLLLKWSAVHNLTAIRSIADVQSHHLLDSIAIVPHLRRVCGKPHARLLDVGSGGGLPGIPIAIACPEFALTLLDASRKRCAFLLQAGVELRLANVEVAHARVEQWRAPPFDIIVARAFSSLRDLVAMTRHLLHQDGAWIAMKGPAFEPETADLPQGVAIAEAVQLEVPGLGARRNLIVLRAR